MMNVNRTLATVVGTCYCLTLSLGPSRQPRFPASHARIVNPALQVGMAANSNPHTGTGILLILFPRGLLQFRCLPNRLSAIRERVSVPVPVYGNASSQCAAYQRNTITSSKYMYERKKSNLLPDATTYTAARHHLHRPLTTLPSFLFLWLGWNNMGWECWVL